MSGIAGIAASGESERVERMLRKIAHRGPVSHAIISGKKATLGVVWPVSQTSPLSTGQDENVVRDFAGPGHLAQATETASGVKLVRDEVGAAPLYYGRTKDGLLCFASEAKALLELAVYIHELPPGHTYDGKRLERYFRIEAGRPLTVTSRRIAAELRRRLTLAVERRVAGADCEIGAWLSGGIDSSAMAALARPYVKRLSTFVAGVPGAPDLKYARQAAAFLKTEHHEVVVRLPQMLAVLPDVIYYLESFDALLVRSSITNYLVAKLASQRVSAVLSGEGGDELFAGYEYLESIPPEKLQDELVDITGRLHNTALQRVDRSATAHGMVAHVCFLDPDVVEYALRIPVKYKIKDGVEKWILRQALKGLLPRDVLNRKKAKFWQGAGVGEQLAEHAEKRVSDADFRRGRRLHNGWVLNSKEELMYYRIFRERFGTLPDLSWMGRTKGAPVSP